MCRKIKCTPPSLASLPWAGCITRYSSRIAPINDMLVRLAGCKAYENKPYSIFITVHSNHSLCPSIPKFTDPICSVYQDPSSQKVASVWAYMCSILWVMMKEDHIQARACLCEDWALSDSMQLSGAACWPVRTCQAGSPSVPNLGTDGHDCPSVPILGTDGHRGFPGNAPL